MSILNKVINKQRTNKVVIEIVQEIVRINTYMPDEKVINKLKEAFVSNKAFEKVRDDIMAVYEVCRNEVLKRVILKNSFYKNCRVTNFVLAAALEKQEDLITCTQTVRLIVYFVGDESVCLDCIKQLKGVNVTPDLNTEVTVQPKDAWFFSQTYICSYCFTNKLYSKI
ncbi:unknown [Cryptophlebia leucotreta granulovirus]|uniref:Uncharacterized protein n=1 Tax=Cryptophlebia leucotreta granulosis virus TaxID=35254 RepID=Q7T5I8_GVCL|nr:hypothetical protein [Cryptophlebia leucotreta granulovirus]AAQ21700.1 unknown [Cryptophlebia leucotreta granulovirus]